MDLRLKLQNAPLHSAVTPLTPDAGAACKEVAVCWGELELQRYFRPADEYECGLLKLRHRPRCCWIEMLSSRECINIKINIVTMHCGHNKLCALMSSVQASSLSYKQTKLSYDHSRRPHAGSFFLLQTDRDISWQYPYKGQLGDFCLSNVHPVTCTCTHLYNMQICNMQFLIDWKHAFEYLEDIFVYWQQNWGHRVV